MKVLIGKEMQELDKIVIHELGIPAEVLMERAGLGVAENIFKYFPVKKYPKVLIICGPGNNGGDGFVCARYIWDMGYKVKVILLSEEEKYKGEALTNLKILKNLDFNLEKISTLEELKKVLDREKPQIIVDAIFGTGLKREITGFLAEVINLININKHQENYKVVAIDIPSGICSETGQIMGCAVKADLTVTFELIKAGHLFYPGKEYTGILEVVKIGFPSKIIEEKGPSREYLDWNWAKKFFKPRTGYTHKGTFGHVLILAGSRGKSGAGILSALGALRGGAGLVTLASTKTLQKIYSTILPEILTAGLEEEASGEISFKSLEKFLTLCEGKRVIVIGPGLGLSEGVRNFLKELLSKINIPLVIDADALTLLSEEPEILKNYKGLKVLTPHPGEAQRFLKISIKEILSNRLKALEEIVKLTDSIVVLKGPHSVIMSPDGKVGISSVDEPGLSQGGMGDILSGLIGALLAQNYEPFLGTCLAVFLHGEAGRYLHQKYGPYGFTATEVGNTIPKLLKILEEKKSHD